MNKQAARLSEQRTDTAIARTLAYPLNYFPYEV